MKDNFIPLATLLCRIISRPYGLKWNGEEHQDCCFLFHDGIEICHIELCGKDWNLVFQGNGEPLTFFVSINSTKFENIKKRAIERFKVELAELALKEHSKNLNIHFEYTYKKLS